jgi:hypothetical protein
MPSAKPLGHQVLNGLAEKFGLSVTKKLRRARVRATNHPLGIRDKDCVWRDIEKVLQGGLSELGPSVLSRSRNIWFRRIRRAH